MKTRQTWFPARARHATLLVAVGILAGCAAASSSPEWDRRFGDAARQVRAAQVIDPQASQRNKDIQGIDGKAAAGAMKGYAESYGYAVKEAKQPALSISTTGSK
jgi:hypothetical protein